MFIRNTVIDKNKIQDVVNNRMFLTYESLKKEWDEVCALSREMDMEPIPNKEFNFYEMYDLSLSTSLFDLSLVELEFIRENNLFDLDENNIQDLRCKMILDKKINDYKSTLDGLQRFLQNGNLGSYFSNFGDLFHMSAQGLKITKILDLDNDSVELTPEGIKLKECIKNITTLHTENFKSAKRDFNKKK